MTPWEELMELPSISPVASGGVNALRAQHSITPFKDAVLVTAPGMMLYLFIGDDIIGCIEPKLAYRFGEDA